MPAAPLTVPCHPRIQDSKRKGGCGKHRIGRPRNQRFRVAEHMWGTMLSCAAVADHRYPETAAAEGPIDNRPTAWQAAQAVHGHLVARRC